MPLIGCVKNLINLKDPYEKFNRAMFGFDQAVDYLVYRHVTKVYKTITPLPLQRDISSNKTAFTNLGMLTTMPNDVLQGKFHWMFIDSLAFYHQ